MIGNYWEGVKEVQEQLSDPVRVEEIYQTMMLPLWESTPQDHRHYESRKNGLAAMEAYRNGTYSVFGRSETLRPLSAVQPTELPVVQEVPADPAEPASSVEIVDGEPVEVHHLLAKELVRFYREFDHDYFEELGGSDDEAIEVLEQQLHVADSRKRIAEHLVMFLDEIDPEKAIAVDMELALEQIRELPEEPDLMGKVISYENDEPYRIIDIKGYRMDDEVILQSVDKPDKYTTDVYGFICALALRSEQREEAKRLIDEYCMEVFEQGADYTDLYHVDLAFSSTADSMHNVEIFADLMRYRLVYQVDSEIVHEIACDSMGKLNEYLAMVSWTDRWWMKKP